MVYTTTMPQNIDITVSLPADLLAKIDILHWDIVRGKPKHGARSRLIQKLLRTYLREREEESIDEQRNADG